MDQFTNAVATTSKLVELVGGSDAIRVGMTLKVSYDKSIVLVNDRWRVDAGGLPHNSILLGAAFGPQKLATAKPIDRQVVVMRIVGRADIESDRDAVRALTEYFQEKPTAEYDGLADMERLTRAQLQWSGIECKILGTFRINGADLTLSSDVGDFFAARPMVIYKPNANALEQIVNYVDPLRRKKSLAAARAAGKRPPESFQIGTVRFASTRYGPEIDKLESVPVRVDPSDFLARRTGVFGMTRTGKSNTTKTMVSAVTVNAFRTGQPIGQLIFDINGEYANVNDQDGGSAINEVFADNTVRYRARHTRGFRDLRMNFYDDIAIALELIAFGFEEQKRAGGGNDLKNFMNANLAKPEDANDRSSMNRWKRRASIFRSILYKAGYQPDAQNKARQEIEVGKTPLGDVVRRGLESSYYKPADVGLDDGWTGLDDDALADAARAYFGLSKAGGRSAVHTASLEDMSRFWTAVREIEHKCGANSSQANSIRKEIPKKGPSTPWLDDEERSLLSILVGRSWTNDTPIVSGSAIYGAGKDFHGSAGSGTLVEDVYHLLSQGRIIILDLSVGHPKIREQLARRLIQGLFFTSAEIFNSAKSPPKIVVYVEEAHNLIGKGADLTEIWPRVAKEGAKYGIALVYATQEPSSVHPNILANTENFFVTHLNNDDEIRSIAKYNDFADFARSLKTCSDVGFARIKTLSAPFVVPTQILEFRPDKVREEYVQAKEIKGNDWFAPLDGNDTAGALSQDSKDLFN